MPAVYEFRVEGQLDPCWAEWLEGLTVMPMESGETLLSGSITDQSALYGLINLLRDMNLCLISVERKGEYEGEEVKGGCWKCCSERG